MARRPNPALHAHWRDRIGPAVGSGLSIEQFCGSRTVCQVGVLGVEALNSIACAPIGSMLDLTRPIDFFASHCALVQNDDTSQLRSRQTFRANPPSYSSCKPSVYGMKLIRSIARTKTHSGGS